MEGFEAAEGKYPYPDTVIEFAKVLRERGVNVIYEHDRKVRQYASLNATDIWIPIVQVTYETLLALNGHLLAEIVMNTFGIERAKKGKLHVEYHATDQAGNDRSLKIDGDGEDVLKAISLFERKMLE